MAFLFGKKKEEPAPAKKITPVPIPPAKPSSAAPVGSVNPDDFFKKMGRKPTSVRNIETPEVTGLRESAAARPEILIRNAREVDTDVLIDKSVLPPDENLGNINQIGTEFDIDAELAAQKAQLEAERIARAEAAAAPKSPVTADDFFANMGRKAKPKEEKFDIDVPDTSSLREAPPERQESTIGGFGDVNTDQLADKSGYDNSFVHGDINAIDLSRIDLSGLRDEQ